MPRVLYLMGDSAHRIVLNSETLHGIDQEETGMVERQLWEYILASRLVPGQKLPSENELSVKLGVGRSAIREGLKTLEAVGTIHQGFRSRVLLCEVEEALKTDR